jgi:valyl-tRNA synthetase
MTNTNANKISSAEEYFTQNGKFFNNGDTNGKRAFFTLGQYCRKVMECQEKAVSENGKQDKFQAQVTRLAASNMTYRIFSALTKLLDATALTCNSKLFQSCSGACKQYLIQADFLSDKKALSVEDANTAFSLGLYQKF